jgi:hypothetical protein
MFQYGAMVPPTTPPTTPPSNESTTSTAPTTAPITTVPTTVTPKVTAMNTTLTGLPPVRGFDYHLYHAVLMLLAWWVMTSASAFFARYLKDVGDYWGVVHLVLGVLTVLLTFAGFALAIVGVNGGELIATDPHHYLGYALMFLVLVQPAIGVYAQRKFDPARASVPIWPDGVHNVFGYVVWLGFAVQTYLGVLRRSASVFGDGDPIPQLVALSFIVVFVVVVFVAAQVLAGRSVLDESRAFAAQVNAKATGSAPERPRGVLCGMLALLVVVTLIGTAGVVATFSTDVSTGVPPWALCGAVLGVCAIAIGLLIFFVYKRRKAQQEEMLLGTQMTEGAPAPYIPAPTAVGQSANFGSGAAIPPPLYGQPQDNIMPSYSAQPPQAYGPGGDNGPTGYSQNGGGNVGGDYPVPSYTIGRNNSGQYNDNNTGNLQPISYPAQATSSEFTQYKSAVYNEGENAPVPAYSQRAPPGPYDGPQSTFQQQPSLRPSQPQFHPVINPPPGLPGLPPPIATDAPITSNPVPPPPPMPGMRPPARPAGGLPPPLAALPPPLAGMPPPAMGNAVNIDWNVSEGDDDD